MLFTSSIKTFLSISVLANIAKATFGADTNTNLVAYWGQNAGGSQGTLATYCTATGADVIVLTYLDAFPTLALDFTNQCSDTFDDGLLHCTQIGEDIKTCQSLGKKIFLSLGGSTTSNSLESDSEGTTLATTLWNKFGGGTDTERPFDDAIVDGFDFGIGSYASTGLVALADGLKAIFDEQSTSYYLSASPQCTFPDSTLGDVMTESQIDFVFIQFYGNTCNVNGDYNWDTWASFAADTAANKDIKIFLGVTADTTATGYLSAGFTHLALQSIATGANFGGVSIWDASLASDSNTFLSVVKIILNTYAPVVSSFAAASSSASSSSSSSASSSASSTSSSSSSAVSSSSASSVVSSSSASSVVSSSASSAATSSAASSAATSSVAASSAASSAAASSAASSAAASSVASSAVASSAASSVAATSGAASSGASSAVAASSGAASSGAASSTAVTGAASSGATLTVSNIATTVITITSCSDNKCTEVPVTTGLTTVTEVDTTYTTYCPLTTESSAVSPAASSAVAPAVTSAVAPVETSAEATRTVIKTTVITLTSCADNKCTEVPVTTGLTTVTDVDSVYTTYCPLTVSSSVVSVAPVVSSAAPVTTAATSANSTAVPTFTVSNGAVANGAKFGFAALAGGLALFV